MSRKSAALLVAATALAGASSAGGQAGPTSADGDVAVSSVSATVEADGRLKLSVTCADTGNDTGCPSGRVVLLRRGQVESTGGQFGALENGERFKASLRLTKKLRTELFERETLAIKSQARVGTGESGLLREVKLKASK